MDEFEKVAYGLGCLMKSNRCAGCGYRDCATFADCVVEIARDAFSLLKEQAHEISRLKHHVDCNAAEKTLSGCMGYGHGFNDDEPCEPCKNCKNYAGYCDDEE